MIKLNRDFYTQDALIVAPLLIGKILVRKLANGSIIRHRITETEAYCGEADSACHAKVGKTNRTITLYEKGGTAYVYLCYGIHYLFNVVTGLKDQPQAVLIRAVEGYSGPARLTKIMQIDKTFNGIDLTKSKELWIEDDGKDYQYTKAKRVGINYAAEPYRSIEWRFMMKQ